MELWASHLFNRGRPSYGGSIDARASIRRTFGGQLGSSWDAVGLRAAPPNAKLLLPVQGALSPEQALSQGVPPAAGHFRHALVITRGAAMRGQTTGERI